MTQEICAHCHKLDDMDAHKCEAVLVEFEQMKDGWMRRVDHYPDGTVTTVHYKPEQPITHVRRARYWPGRRLSNDELKKLTS